MSDNKGQKNSTAGTDLIPNTILSLQKDTSKKMCQAHANENDKNKHTILQAVRSKKELTCKGSHIKFLVDLSKEILWIGVVRYNKKKIS